MTDGLKTAFTATLLVAATALPFTAAKAADCDKACLEDIAADYRDAYLAHDPSQAPIAEDVRYTENNVEMPFPDGTWDTVTETLDPVLTLSDPVTGNIGVYIPIVQNDIEGYLAARLKVEDEEITEIEHIISTKRNLSNPPTPIADHADYDLPDVVFETVPPEERLSREELIARADGYFQTLERNNGEIRNTCFLPDATRRENGLRFTDIKGGFESGRYLFNNRVRRDHILVDEERQVALARGFIDHKGVLDEYELTDGTKTRSIFREPQSWGLIESFKIKDGCIAAVVATFYQAPYYTVSPWSEEED